MQRCGRGDPPLLITGVLPCSVGCSALQRAEWYDSCSIAESEFLALVNEAKMLLPGSHRREHHSVLRRVKLITEKAKKMAYFVISDTMPPNIAVVLKKWEHNPDGVPVAIWQEPDGSLNYTDVDIWIWLKVILPKKGYVLLRQQILKLFSIEGFWATMIHDQAYVSPQGDMLWELVKLQYDLGTQKPEDIPFEGLSKWLGQWAGMMRDHVVWVEGYTTCALSGNCQELILEKCLRLKHILKRFGNIKRTCE